MIHAAPCFAALVIGFAAAKPPPAALKKLNDHEYQLGLVRIDAARREIRFPARVNMTQGPIELVLCTESGKTHESVFAASARPLHIQTALLLLGARPGPCPGDAAARGAAPGDPVVVLIQYKGQPPQRAERFVWRSEANRPMRSTTWTFTGSRIVDGRYAADAEGSIVATYYDPLAILNNPLPSRANDELYEVNTRTVPKLGSLVTVILKLEKPSHAKK